MRRVFGVLFVCVILGLLCGEVCLSDSSSAPTIRIIANVKDSLEIKVDLKKDVSGYPDLPDDTLMDFGTLILNPANADGSLVAETGVVAFVYVNSHRIPYTVYSNIGQSLSSGAYVLPDGAVVLNSVCKDEDQPHGGACEGAAGYSGTAIGNRIIYRSGGKNRDSVIQAHYTITDDRSLGATDYVPVDQFGGTYESALVITVVR